MQTRRTKKRKKQKGSTHSTFHIHCLLPFFCPFLSFLLGHFFSFFCCCFCLPTKIKNPCSVQTHNILKRTNNKQNKNKQTTTKTVTNDKIVIFLGFHLIYMVPILIKPVSIHTHKTTSVFSKNESGNGKEYSVCVCVMFHQGFQKKRKIKHFFGV